MSEKEIVKVVELNVEPARKSIKDLKKEVEDMAIGLAALDKSSEEYEQGVKDLADKQQQLNDAMSLAKNANSAAAGSYDDLSAQLRKARKEWHALAETDPEWEAKRDEVNRLNNELKRMDASVGVFNRNVGNYGNELGQAFTQVGSIIGGNFVGAVKTANGALKAMSANPVGGFLMLIVPLIQKVVEGFKGSEENTRALALAFSPLKALGDKVANMFSTLAGYVAKAAEKLGELAEKYGLITDEMKYRQELTRDEIALENRRRLLEEDAAKTELEVAKLRADASDKLNKTASERKAALEQAVTLEGSISARRVKLAQDEAEAMRKAQELSPNDKAANEAYLAAKVKAINEETRHYQKLRELKAGIAEAAAAMKGGATAAGELAEAEAKATAAAAAFKIEYAERVNKAKVKAQDEARKAEYDAEVMQAETIAGVWRQHNAKMEEVRQQDAEMVKATEEAKRAMYAETAGAIGSVFGSIADLLEANEEGAVKNATAIKGLRIAQATIETINGAINAYMQAQAAYPPPVGQIVGGASAAAVTAAGVAQIAKIKATNVTASGGSASASAATSGTSTTSGITTTSPAVIKQVQTMRTETGAKSETRLNDIASMLTSVRTNNYSPKVVQQTQATRTLTGKSEEEKKEKNQTQRVVLVYSDLEAAGNRVSVQRSESTF